MNTTVQRVLNDIDRNPKFYKNHPLKAAGSGALENEVLRRHFFDGTIEYFGNLSRDKVKEFIKPLKWVVFPSIYEPWGQVVTECMAMGKICMVQEGVSGMSEQVLDGINGFHVDMARTSISEFILSKERSGINFDAISRAARRDAQSICDHVDALSEVCQLKEYA